VKANCTYFFELFSNTVLYGFDVLPGVAAGCAVRSRHHPEPGGIETAVLGILALLISGIGGILGGYAMYYCRARSTTR
jgi:hypothetical protein